MEFHADALTVEVAVKVQQLIASRKHTRSRTYDFLLKGLLFCHECGYPMAVINRKNAAGEDVLYLVCLTYQRFTKAGVCTSHAVKEKTVTDAVLAKVQEVCEAYLKPEQLQPMAEAAVEKQQSQLHTESDVGAIQRELDALTAKLDKTYFDRLNEIISEDDFRRFYQMLSERREELTAKRDMLAKQLANPLNSKNQARELVARFMESACTSREVLAGLIERVELTENKEIIIRFRFRELEKMR